jgi:hypothetical protein
MSASNQLGNKSVLITRIKVDFSGCLNNGIAVLNECLANNLKIILLLYRKTALDFI